MVNVNAMTPLTTDCGRAGLQKCANTTISDLELSEASFYRVLIIPKGSMLRQIILNLTCSRYIYLFGHHTSSKKCNCSCSRKSLGIDKKQDD